MTTGRRADLCELSTVDTSFLLAGMLAAAEYFNQDSEAEREIRTLADALYRRVDWPWARAGGATVTHGWKPESGFLPYRWEGYDEALILYVLALGSPTHPIPADSYAAWSRTYSWERFYGRELLYAGPLFIHQYSHLWIDFRGIQDAFMREKGIDYFENSRRATYAQRAYAIDNPAGFKDYGKDVWGLTACIGPGGGKAHVAGREIHFHDYWARGASRGDVRDDGTIAPAAAAGSMPFAPEIVLPALGRMRAAYGGRLFQRYGFIDAFNPTFALTGLTSTTGPVYPEGWFAANYLGIDQGPILLMAENHRSGFVWDVMRQNEYVVRGLCRAGFTGGWMLNRC